MQLAKKSAINSDLTKYNQHKSIIKTLLRQKQWNYVNVILNKSLEHGNNKPLWKYIKAKCNDNIVVAAIKNNSILHHNSKTKAELQNNQSKPVFTINDDTDHLQPCHIQNIPALKT